MLHIRPMTADDWPVVEEIYAEGIRTGVATFETNTPDWNTFDSTRLVAPRLVLSKGPEILGWAAASPVSARSCYRGVVELSIYVREHARGNGVGFTLMEKLEHEALAVGLWTLQATITATNHVSRRLMEKRGFRLVGYRERIGTIGDVWHDTVIYEKRL